MQRAPFAAAANGFFSKEVVTACLLHLGLLLLGLQQLLLVLLSLVVCDCLHIRKANNETECLVPPCYDCSSLSQGL